MVASLLALTSQPCGLEQKQSASRDGESFGGRYTQKGKPKTGESAIILHKRYNISKNLDRLIAVATTPVVRT